MMLINIRSVEFQEPRHVEPGDCCWAVRSKVRHTKGAAEWKISSWFVPKSKPSGNMKTCTMDCYAGSISFIDQHSTIEIELMRQIVSTSEFSFLGSAFVSCTIGCQTVNIESNNGRGSITVDIEHEKPQKSPNRINQQPNQIQWIYQDDDGILRGPFDTRTIMSWTAAGFFEESTVFAALDGGGYKPLFEVIEKMEDDLQKFVSKHSDSIAATILTDDDSKLISPSHGLSVAKTRKNPSTEMQGRVDRETSISKKHEVKTKEKINNLNKSTQIKQKEIVMEDTGNRIKLNSNVKDDNSQTSESGSPSETDIKPDHNVKIEKCIKSNTQGKLKNGARLIDYGIAFRTACATHIQAAVRGWLVRQKISRLAARNSAKLYKEKIGNDTELPTSKDRPLKNLNYNHDNNPIRWANKVRDKLVSLGLNGNGRIESTNQIPCEFGTWPMTYIYPTPWQIPTGWNPITMAAMQRNFGNHSFCCGMPMPLTTGFETGMPLQDSNGSHLWRGFHCDHGASILADNNHDEYEDSRVGYVRHGSRICLPNTARCAPGKTKRQLDNIWARSIRPS